MVYTAAYVERRNKAEKNRRILYNVGRVAEDGCPEGSKDDDRDYDNYSGDSRHKKSEIGALLGALGIIDTEVLTDKGGYRKTYRLNRKEDELVDL